MATAEGCYKHSDRAASVLCARCERGICSYCMLPSADGHRCPDCAGLAPLAGRGRSGAGAGSGPERETGGWRFETAAEAEVVFTCYRHRERETGVFCVRCDRPICHECMVSAAVGFQCVECVDQAARGQRQWVGTGASARIPVTQALILANAVVFVAVLLVTGNFSIFSGSITSVHADFALLGAAVDLDGGWWFRGELRGGGEWWRIFTSGFLHYGLVHLGMNMFILLLIGRLLEPTLGGLRFGLLYAVGLLGGSAGALLVEPGGLTAGASGAVFGIAAAVVVAERSGASRWGNSGMLGLLILNIVLGFLIPNVSVGGHMGGMIAGGAGAVLLWRGPLRDAAGREGAMRYAPDAAMAALGAGLGLLAIYVAAPTWSNPLF